VVDVAREPGPVRPGREGVARPWRDGPTAAARGLSIVVPVHNEAASLPRLHAALTDVAGTLGAKYGLACEVIYVDDGSRDDTLAIVHQLPASTVDIQAVSLSRNFGKEAALLAGLDHARLGAVLFMDGDGQHPPSLVENLVRHWLEDGYDVVYTAKAHRENESPVRRFLAKGFYVLINWAFELDRLSSDPRRLSARGTHRRPLDLEPALADRVVDRRLDCIFGSAVAGRDLARIVAGVHRIPLWRRDRL
jgi:glycosyltransferase involved in cell wall biosynthesis